MLTRLECDQLQGGVSALHRGLDSVGERGIELECSPQLRTAIFAANGAMTDLWKALERERAEHSFEAVAPEEAEQP